MTKLTLSVCKAYKNSGRFRIHRKNTSKHWKHYFIEDYFDEGEFDKTRVDTWLNHYNLERIQSHCSGHSKGQDLLDVMIPFFFINSIVFLSDLA